MPQTCLQMPRRQSCPAPSACAAPHPAASPHSPTDQSGPAAAEDEEHTGGPEVRGGSVAGRAVAGCCRGAAAAASASGAAGAPLQLPPHALRLPSPPARPAPQTPRLACGRSSPSAGLPLPIMMNLAGCWMEMPSRSTVFCPPAAAGGTEGRRAGRAGGACQIVMLQLSVALV